VLKEREDLEFEVDVGGGEVDVGRREEGGWREEEGGIPIELCLRLEAALG
jgi:hypothetical protein